MNKDDFTKQIITILNSGLNDIRPEVARKLQAAREQACAAAEHTSHKHKLQSAHSLTWSDWIRHHRAGFVGMLFVLALSTVAVMWQTSFSNEEDTAEIDTALLTGDLPVNAYLDGHLSKWVNNSSDF